MTQSTHELGKPRPQNTCFDPINPSPFADSLPKDTPAPLSAMPFKEEENSDRGTKRRMPACRRENLFTPEEMDNFVKNYLYERAVRRMWNGPAVLPNEEVAGPGRDLDGPQPPATAPPLYLMKKSQYQDVPIGGTKSIGVAAALNYARKVFAIGARPRENTQ